MSSTGAAKHDILIGVDSTQSDVTIQMVDLIANKTWSLKYVPPAIANAPEPFEAPYLSGTSLEVIGGGAYLQVNFLNTGQSEPVSGYTYVYYADAVCNIPPKNTKKHKTNNKKKMKEILTYV
jgi:hypothetical protein